MRLSLVPLLALLTLAFGVFITAKARKDQSINGAEARSVYFLVLLLAVWTVILIALGIGGIHVTLMDRIPLLWQSGIPVTILFINFILSRNLRRALHRIASSTPQHWLVFFQALRIGALGGDNQGHTRADHLQLCPLDRHTRFLVWSLRHPGGVVAPPQSR